VNSVEGKSLPHLSHASPTESNPLDTCFFTHHAAAEDEQLGPSDGPFHRWLSVEQIRKMERMRRETVLEAMRSGELPFEQRGRIRYARLSDVLAWEERRLCGDTTPSRRSVAPELADLVG